MFSNKKAFTLLELLVVIAIIGVLAAIVMASLNSARVKARDARRLQDIKTIQTNLEIYYNTYNSYPPTPTGGWIHSSETTWDGLENSMGMKLPRDPVNQASPWLNDQSRAWSSDQRLFMYDYLSGSVQNGCATGTFYWLVYRLEKGNTPVNESPGVFMCDGSTFKAVNGAITVGANSK